jgi:hypothetical protein
MNFVKSNPDIVKDKSRRKNGLTDVLKGQGDLLMWLGFLPSPISNKAGVKRSRMNRIPVRRGRGREGG